MLFNFLPEVIIFLTLAFLALVIVLFCYALLNYFVLGPGDEGRKIIGRKNLLKANTGMIIVLGIVLVLNGITWVTETLPDTRIIEETRVQPVPNVPFQNN